MELFIFQFNRDEHLIDSFLEAASKAHGDPIKDREWFHWKFAQSPYGETLLACAKVQDVIAGCVGLGIQDFYQDGVLVKGAISYETFVNPEFQGHGLFKKLIAYAEEEAKKKGIELLLNFPNNNSLPGFLRMGWSQMAGSKYYLKAHNLLRCLRYITDIKQFFVPLPSNLLQLDQDAFANCKEQILQKSLVQRVTPEYLTWRFLSYPVGHYVIFNSEEVCSVARVGKRGHLTELQILVVLPQRQKQHISWRRLLKAFRKEIPFDLVGVPTSAHCSLISSLKRNLFLSVPNRGHECYKLLAEKESVCPNKIDYQAIMAHTY